MRRLVLVITGLLLASVAALLFTFRSESSALHAVHWAMATFTDLRLELRNPHLDVYGGTLTAEEIHLVSDSGEGPALVSLLDVSAGFSLGGLLLTDSAVSDLRAGSLLIYVSDQKSQDAPAPTQWLGYLGWLPAHLELGQVHLITASANTWIFPLKAVRGERLASGDYRLLAAADYSGEPLSTELDLFELHSRGDRTGASARLLLQAPQSGSMIKLEGQLQGSSRQFSYDVAVHAAYRDISDFLQGFEGGKNLAGALSLEGKVRGDEAGLALTDGHFLLDNMPAYGFEATGELGYQWSGDSRIELTANGELASLDYLVDWLGADVPGLERVQSSVQLSGSLDRPVISSFLLTTGNTAGLQLSLSGAQIKLYPEDVDAPSGNTVFVDAQGPSAKVLQPWLGELPYDPGPWRASARLSGNEQALAVADLVVETGTPETVQLRATGGIANIALPATGEQSAPAASGIALHLQALVPDSAQLEPYLGRELPPYHEVRASLDLAGDQQALQLTAGEVTIEASDTLARISALQAQWYPGKKQPLSAVRGDISLALSDFAALSQYTSVEVPVLGPVRVTAQLRQQGARFDLRDIVASIESPGFTLQAQGAIADLTGLARPAIQAHINFADPELLQVVAKLPLQPLEADLQVSSSEAGVHALLEAEIGRNNLRADSVVAFDEGAVQSLQFSVVTPHLYLADLFSVHQSLLAAQAAPAGEDEPVAPLERLRRSPPGFPVDAAVSIGGISGDNTHIDSLALRVTGRDHRYTLENFSIVYGSALAEARGIVDIQARPAAVSLAASATALPIAAILADAGVSSSASGELTVLGGVTLTGDSGAELIANLNGSVAVALEDAVIEGAAYDLLATDLLAWIYSGAMAEDSTFIDCAMAKFDFRQGVASSDSLYIESPRMVATGSAEFDLVRQRMDLRITPLSKSRSLQVPSEVRLHGKMSKPEASISAVSAVADAASSALMLIPELTMKLFGVKQQSAGSYRPCKAELGG